VSPAAIIAGLNNERGDSSVKSDFKFDLSTRFLFDLLSADFPNCEKLILLPSNYCAFPEARYFNLINFLFLFDRRGAIYISLSEQLFLPFTVLAFFDNLLIFISMF